MTPDEILQLTGQDLVWALIEDIQSSYRLAMQGAGIDAATADEITGTVTDYVANHYGDD